MSARSDFSRLDRVASTVRKVLAGPIGELARGQGAGMATITEVELAPDLRRGTVYLSVYGDEADRHGFIALLNERSGEIQATLGRALRTKRTPVLNYRLDAAYERGDRIGRLLGETRDERPGNDEAGDDETGAGA